MPTFNSATMPDLSGAQQHGLQVLESRAAGRGSRGESPVDIARRAHGDEVPSTAVF